ncbi:hypothetical protein Mapa_005839 [Marchantia paleacea]|nr:hypothetical protein Mapa_005839 [Marchantia paleacea]
MIQNCHTMMKALFSISPAGKANSKHENLYRETVGRAIIFPNSQTPSDSYQSKMNNG